MLILKDAGEAIKLAPGTGITSHLNEVHCHKQHARELLFSMVMKLTTLALCVNGAGALTSLEGGNRLWDRPEAN